MMKKVNLGKRHRCHACGTKFYDLNNPNPVCPKCGERPSDNTKRFIRSVKPVNIEAEPGLIDVSEDNVEILSLEEIESEEEFADLV